MAERRMFAKSIVLSDAFLDMPTSARCLYFTLSMLADDDGFVGSPKAIVRQCGASQDDMSILIGKRYVLGFDSGVIVIKHWRMNNYLQKDRHKPTTYLEELSTLTVDGKGSYTECIQNVSKVYTQYSIGKNSIDKFSIDNISCTNDGKDFELFWSAYPKKVGKEVAKKSFMKLKDIPVDVLLSAIENQKLSRQWKEDKGKYIPNPSTWLNQHRWEDNLEMGAEEDWKQKEIENVLRMFSDD